jgi:anti-anti-sigma factor
MTAIGEATLIDFIHPCLLDEDMIQDIGLELRGLAEDPTRSYFVLTFAGVTEICSALLAVLLAFHKRVETNGRRMALCAVGPDIRRWFVTTRLDRVLHLFSTEAEALQAAQRLG